MRPWQGARPRSSLAAVGVLRMLEPRVLLFWMPGWCRHKNQRACCPGLQGRPRAGRRPGCGKCPCCQSPPCCQSFPSRMRIPRARYAARAHKAAHGHRGRELPAHAHGAAVSFAAVVNFLRGPGLFPKRALRLPRVQRLGNVACQTGRTRRTRRT